MVLTSYRLGVQSRLIELKKMARQGRARLLIFKSGLLQYHYQVPLDKTLDAIGGVEKLEMHALWTATGENQISPICSRDQRLELPSFLVLTGATDWEAEKECLSRRVVEKSKPGCLAGVAVTK